MRAASIGALLGLLVVVGSAEATVTLTPSRGAILYTTDTQFDCGDLARTMDADLPFHVVRLRADDDTGTADSFRWKLPKPNVGYLMPDDPQIDSSAGGAFALRGFCAEFGSGCVLTKQSLRAYQRPTILWAAPTCADITNVTRRPFEGESVRFKVVAKNGGRKVGKATADVSYGTLGTPTLFVSARGEPVDDGLGKNEVVTFVNPIFSIVLDPAIADATPSPIAEWVINNGAGEDVRLDSCNLPSDLVAPGAQACAQIDYESGGRFVARAEVRLDDGSAYCDKLRCRVGQCRGRAKINFLREPKKKTYRSGDIVDFAVEFQNRSGPNGCTFGFERMTCSASFKLGPLEESNTTTFVLPSCKENGALRCDTDDDCIVLGIDRGPCLAASHCSETTEQPCDSDIDCRIASCPTCRPNESCIRVITLPQSVLEDGIRPGERVILHEETIEVQSVLPGRAKISETWSVETENLATFAGEVNYKIRGVPPQ